MISTIENRIGAHATQYRKREILAAKGRDSTAIIFPISLQLWRLQRVLVYIEGHLSDNIKLLELSTQAGFSPMHFASQFRMATGMRPHDYVIRRKIEEAQMLLLTSSTPIVDIALSFGFLSQAHFTTVFKRFVGSPPLRWQHLRKRQIQSAIFRLEHLPSVRFLTAGSTSAIALPT